ncbi:MAG: hypothetical protein JXA77_05870 [Bacteroidales bacterium]|nr:hypothetical protein [Bacteroidales bacterium]
MKYILIIVIIIYSSQWAFSTQGKKKELAKIAFLTGKEDAEGGNEAIISHLNKKGYHVELLIDSLTSADFILTETFDLLILPSTIGSWRAGKFKDIEIPIMAWESYAFDKELGLVPDNDNCYGGVPFAESDDELINEIEIVGNAHGLNAGYKGKVKVLKTAKWKESVENPESNYVFGIPGENAFKIAKIGNMNQYAIFGYEKGKEMAEKGFFAPDKRLAYYFHHAAPVYLTRQGWDLFDAAIEWLLNY